MALGVFDSGVGGLTVYRELATAYPFSDLIYLGDTARVPYGNKSTETIKKYTLECAGYLVDNYKINALIVACNTMSSWAMLDLEDKFGLPVIGVIRAGAERALEVTKNNKIGVIGTRATVRSKAYVNMLTTLGVNSQNVFQQACPLLVPIVEEGVITGNIPEQIIKYYLDSIVVAGVDTIILGCTHYPVLLPLLKEIYPQVTFVDSATSILRHINKGGLAHKESGHREILITDESPAFDTLMNMLVGDIGKKTVSLGGI